MPLCIPSTLHCSITSSIVQSAQNYGEENMSVEVKSLLMFISLQGNCYSYSITMIVCGIGFSLHLWTILGFIKRKCYRK